MRCRFDKCLDGLLPDGGAVLLAVSGGVDSIVMADLFLRSRFGKNITVAHCNFHLRGEESDGDEVFVRSWAESNGIPFRKVDFDTVGYASSKGISVEMAARELRYSWFASLCEAEGFQAVAVAHNANDNAETLILNLLRGTGLKGICGMRDVSPLPGSQSAKLIRPLLWASREDILEYAVSQGLKWREDSTNSDSAYKRNLIRNEVFPLFERVNPSFIETLNADMSRFSQARDVADDAVAGFIGGDKINVTALRGIPHWEYVLYRFLEPYGFNQAVIEDIAGLIKSGATFSGRRFYSGMFTAETSRDSISVRPVDSSDSYEKQAEDLIVEAPGEYSIDGIGFVVERAEVEDPRQPEGITVVDLDFPIVIRHWRPGDWMRPIGMKGRKKKLSDMFNDLRFSAERKEKALVIADEGSHILSLIGYRVDESVAVTGREALRIRFI